MANLLHQKSLFKADQESMDDNADMDDFFSHLKVKLEAVFIQLT